MWNQDLYQKALYFAAEAHKKQTIKGTDQNYLAHICHVTAELMGAISQSDSSSIDADLCLCCGLLHDTIEDTDVTYKEIQSIFFEKVADGVLALTKDDRIEKKEQLADSLRRIKQQPLEIHMVKIADRISNLRKPPENWTSEKRMAYLDDAQEILNMLGGANTFLDQRLNQKMEQYRLYITK